MSYMGAYVLWLEENGLEGMEHVERYHKENPHMIPNPRQVGQWQDYSDNRLSDGEVLDLIYDFCEAQVMSHPILEDIIKILKENE